MENNKEIAETVVRYALIDRESKIVRNVVTSIPDYDLPIFAAWSEKHIIVVSEVAQIGDYAHLESNETFDGEYTEEWHFSRHVSSGNFQTEVKPSEEAFATLKPIEPEIPSKKKKTV